MARPQKHVDPRPEQQPAGEKHDEDTETNPEQDKVTSPREGISGTNVGYFGPVA